MKNQSKYSREGVAREKVFTRRFKHKLKNLKHGSVEIKHRPKNGFTSESEQSSSYMEKRNRISEPQQYFYNDNPGPIKSAVPDIKQLRGNNIDSNQFQIRGQSTGKLYENPHNRGDYNLQHSNSEKPSYEHLKQNSLNDEFLGGTYQAQNATITTNYNKGFMDSTNSNSRQLYSNELKKHPRSHSNINYYNESTQYYSDNEPKAPSIGYSSHKEGTPDKHSTRYDYDTF